MFVSRAKEPQPAPDYREAHRIFSNYIADLSDYVRTAPVDVKRSDEKITDVANISLVLSELQRASRRHRQLLVLLWLENGFIQREISDAFGLTSGSVATIKKNAEEFSQPDVYDAEMARIAKVRQLLRLGETP